MIKSLSAAAIILVSMALVWLYVNSFATYTTSDNKEDSCEKHWGTTGEVASSVFNSSADCLVIAKGSFHDAEFLHITCSSKEGERTQSFIFGSKKACGAFKNIGSAEYIKLHLSTILPPNEAFQTKP